MANSPPPVSFLIIVASLAVALPFRLALMLTLALHLRLPHALSLKLHLSLFPLSITVPKFPTTRLTPRNEPVHQSHRYVKQNQYIITRTNHSIGFCQ